MGSSLGRGYLYLDRSSFDDWVIRPDQDAGAISDWAVDGSALFLLGGPSHGLHRVGQIQATRNTPPLWIGRNWLCDDSVNSWSIHSWT